ncbi:MAG TPA: hypothetical protein PLE26_00730 [Candidatus Paceibacterota bacterium]|nr:hypothetical protein [Candidatus Paceibacterota bacterium]
MSEDEKKERIEIPVLKEYLEFNSISLDQKLLQTKVKEPADLIYDNQGYQITTTDGKYFGEVMSATDKYGIEDVGNRTVLRCINTNEVPEEKLKNILKKKGKRSDKNIILLIKDHLVDPFTSKEDRLRHYEKFKSSYKNLIDVWKDVYLIDLNKNVIKLSD